MVKQVAKTSCGPPARAAMFLLGLFVEEVIFWARRTSVPAAQGFFFGSRSTSAAKMGIWMGKLVCLHQWDWTRYFWQQMQYQSTVLGLNMCLQGTAWLVFWNSNGGGPGQSCPTDCHANPLGSLHAPLMLLSIAIFCFRPTWNGLVWTDQCNRPLFFLNSPYTMYKAIFTRAVTPSITMVGAHFGSHQLFFFSEECHHPICLFRFSSLKLNVQGWNKAINQQFHQWIRKYDGLEKASPLNMVMLFVLRIGPSN